MKILTLVVLDDGTGTVTEYHTITGPCDVYDPITLSQFQDSNMADLL